MSHWWDIRTYHALWPCAHLNFEYQLFVAFVTVKIITQYIISMSLSLRLNDFCALMTSLDLPQVSHTNKPSLECVLQWRLRLCSCLNVFFQIPHSNLWSLLCADILCRVSLRDSVNLLLQTSHS